MEKVLSNSWLSHFIGAFNTNGPNFFFHALVENKRIK